MRRGAFTVLEILIVVALIAAISAVVLPSLASRVASAQAGHAVRAIESAVALASAESMRRGEAVELVAEQLGAEWVLYAQAQEPASDLEGPTGLDAERGLPLAPPPGAARVELASFADAELSAILPEVVGGPEADEADSRSEIEEPQPPAGPIAPEAPPLSLRLGMFFPDGACRAISPLYVISTDGVRRSIRLRPLTSRVDVRVLPTVQEEIQQVASSDPADALLPVDRREEER